MVNVKNAARHGYTRINGVSCDSSLMRTKNNRATTVSTIPMTPHNIQEGKNDPRMLNEGAREHPAAHSSAAKVVAAFAALPAGDFVGLRIMLRSLRLQQVGRLVGQRRNSGQQLGACAHIGGARHRQGALCGDHVDLAPNSETV